MTIEEAAQTGMRPAVYARAKPNVTAIFSRRGNRSFAQINSAANQIVRALRRAGLKAGDAIALICPNTPEFIEIYAARDRGGFRLVPVNWHLTATEVAYIVDDCEAKALFACGELSNVADALTNPRLTLKVAIGTPTEGCVGYQQLLSAEDDADIDDPSFGDTMLYTSGTTGRPRGVVRRKPPANPPALSGRPSYYDADASVNLLCGPAYHGGPIHFDLVLPLNSGVPIVLMEKFEAEEALRLIEAHRVTHTHMVATMFQRLLALPPATRRKFDLTSLRVVIHGAAPTPPEVKRAMLDWLGPILWEYYAATEGNGNFTISSEEWLRKPGSVGLVQPGSGCRILDEQGNDCPAGRIGTVYFRRNPAAPFEYFKDAQKTRSAYRDQHFSVGDQGYVDADGYLFLTGRTAECIISGGVNIYPQEIDNELMRHPAVADVCTIGVPNAEWGEEVKAVVALNEGYEPSGSVAAELIAFARTRLASFKIPRSVDFTREIPRSEAGKVLRQSVRARYWAGLEKSI